MLTSAAAPAFGPHRQQPGCAWTCAYEPRLTRSITLTQDLQAAADLALRGSSDHPGTLGRVVATRGHTVFFGAKSPGRRIE